MVSKDKNVTVVLAIIDSIVGIIALLITIGEKSPSTLSIVLWGFFIPIFFIVVFFVVKIVVKKYKLNHIPTPRKNKIGILVSINSYYEESEAFFEKSFYQEFDNIFHLFLNF